MGNPHSKILKINYKGESTEKYYFSEAVKEAKLLKQKDDEKKKKYTKRDIEVLVKDGEEIKKGGVLFNVGPLSVKSKDKGTVSIGEKSIKVEFIANKSKEFIVSRGVSILVEDGDDVKKGDQLTDGSLDLRQLLLLRGRLKTQKYIIKEIQTVYSSQGQPLNDKHIEIVARQMFSRFYILNPGDTNVLPGEIVENSVIQRANDKLKKGQKKIEMERRLLGITKASLTTDSFLSAASFQETARVLIEAAVSGKVDHLEGLKENVIIGRLIPAGTGYKGNKERVDYSEKQ